MLSLDDTIIYVEHTKPFESLTDSELKTLIRIYNQLDPNRQLTTISDLYDIISDNQILTIIRECAQTKEKTIIGFASYYETPYYPNHTTYTDQYLFLHILILDEPYRNTGIGSKALDIIINDNPERPIYLLSEVDNTKAHKLYESFNFKHQSNIQGSFHKCKLYLLDPNQKEKTKRT